MCSHGKNFSMVRNTSGSVIFLSDVVSRRGCQTIILAGVGKKLSSREICTYPKHTIAEAKKIATESSQTVFLHELKHDQTKFQGNRIVKSKIYQAISAA